MTSEPTEPASAVYEIVFEEVGGPKSWLRVAFVFVVNLFAMGAGPTNPGGAVISVRHRDTGEERFRHIEDLGDDEGHLLDGLQRDLAAMTATEFEDRWLN